MDRLVFTAHMAMSEYRVDRHNMTHELANVSTPGFKKAFEIGKRPIRAEGDGFETRYLPRAMTTPLVDLTEGHRMITGRNLDVAMNEATVLAVRSDNNEVAWTRRGDLSTDQEGFLRTGEGHLVLDPSFAPIQLPIGPFTFDIAEDGTINAVDRQNPQAGPVPVSSLGLKDASNADLARREDGLFRPLANTEDRQDFVSGPGAISVTSGALEGSNVSTVETLVRFIDHTRSFEMQTKIIREMKDNDTSGESMMRLS
jgi:flagellar basal-body rod protein FlgF